MNIGVLNSGSIGNAGKRRKQQMTLKEKNRFTEICCALTGAKGVVTGDALKPASNRL